MDNINKIGDGSVQKNKISPTIPPCLPFTDFFMSTGAWWYL